MTAALALSPTAPLDRKAVTITGSGFTASTAYILTITDPAGGVSRPSVVSDGAGAFTYTWYPQLPGTLKVDARPATEHLGTTTALATTGSVTVAQR